MRLHFAPSRAIMICLLGLLSLPAYANTAVVDCTGATPGAFTTINAAINSLPPIGPNTVTVTAGPCTGPILVFRYTDLGIFAGAPVTVQAAVPTQRVMSIFDSHNVGISGPFTFDGGRGAVIQKYSTVDIDGLTIQNSGGLGLTSLDSSVHISNSVIKNSVRSGVSVNGGIFSVDSGVAITGNGRTGISAGTAHLTLNGGDGTPGTEINISNNVTVGVALFNSSEADINSDTRIDHNGGIGLEVFHTSTVLMTDGEINSNTGIGVHCGETSHCEWAGATTINTNLGGGIEITDHSDAYIDGGITISGNTGTGVLVDLSSLLNSLGGNFITNNSDDGIIVNTLSVIKFAANDTVTGNGKLALECNNGSLVSGDVATYKPKKCGPAFQAQPIK